MSDPLKRTLAEIRDELDSRQIVVTFEIVEGEGVRINATELRDRLIAQAELRRACIPIVR